MNKDLGFIRYAPFGSSSGMTRDLTFDQTVNYGNFSRYSINSDELFIMGINLFPEDVFASRVEVTKDAVMRDTCGRCIAKVFGAL
jgi:hypothetical protein